jgi:hypothetical protein
MRREKPDGIIVVASHNRADNLPAPESATESIGH